MKRARCLSQCWSFVVYEEAGIGTNFQNLTFSVIYYWNVFALGRFKLHPLSQKHTWNIKDCL
jgi:hypothetical protein